MLSNKSVLILSPEIPYPVFKGNHQRIDGMIRQMLAQRYRVRLAVLNSNQKGRTSESIKELLERTYPGIDRVEVRQHPKFSRARSASRRLHNAMVKGSNIFLKSTLASVDTCPMKFRRLVRQMLDEEPADVVLVNYLKLTHAIPPDFAGRTVVDTHDVQSHLNIQAEALTGRPSGISLEQLKREEQALLSRYDAVIAINEHEAKVFEEMAPRTEVVTLPAFRNRVPPRLPKGDDYDVLFVGSNSPFNVEAAVNLLSWVIPEIRRRKPDLSVAIAGDVGKHPRVLARRGHGIHVLGRVRDLGDTYFRSKVVVCPLTRGAGMKIKVVEALCHGKAVVSTSVGADGIKIEDGVSGYITDDWFAMADRISRLIEDEALRHRIEDGAADLAESQHSPHSIRPHLRRALGDPPYEPAKENLKATDEPARGQPAGRALVFSMDARLLMGFNLHLGKQLQRLGIDVEFVKVEHCDFNFFHAEGFGVHGLKLHIKDRHRKAVDEWLDERSELLALDRPFEYRSVDLSDLFRTHRAMFPEHYGDNSRESIRHSLILLEALIGLIEPRKPDLVVGWNGDGPYMVCLMRAFAKIIGVPILHVERGLFPDSYVVDPQGVNYKSGLSGGYLPVITDAERAEASAYIQAYNERKKTVVQQVTSIESGDEVRSKLGLRPGERYIVFPEQIETDSNIILNSPWYKKMDQALHDIVEACRPLGLHVVCRPHPEAVVRPAPVDDVIYESDVHLHALLRNATATVVLNSTVGLESLMIGTPTIAIANSIYSGKGMTFDAACPEHIQRHLRHIVEKKFDAWHCRRRLEAFVSLLFSRYLIMMDGSKSDAQNLRTVAAALGSIGIQHGLRRVSSHSKLVDEYLTRRFDYDREIQRLDASDTVVVVDLLRPQSSQYWTGSDRRAVSGAMLKCQLEEQLKGVRLLMVTPNGGPGSDSVGGNGVLSRLQHAGTMAQAIDHARRSVQRSGTEAELCLYLVDSRDAERARAAPPGIGKKEFFLDQYLELV